MHFKKIFAFALAFCSVSAAPLVTDINNANTDNAVSLSGVKKTFDLSGLVEKAGDIKDGINGIFSKDKIVSTDISNGVISTLINLLKDTITTSISSSIGNNLNEKLDDTIFKDINIDIINDIAEIVEDIIKRTIKGEKLSTSIACSALESDLISELTKSVADVLEKNLTKAANIDNEWIGVITNDVVIAIVDVVKNVICNKSKIPVGSLIENITDDGLIGKVISKIATNITKKSKGESAEPIEVEADNSVKGMSDLTTTSTSSTEQNEEELSDEENEAEDINNQSAEYENTLPEVVEETVSETSVDSSENVEGAEDLAEEEDSDKEEN